MIPKLAIAGLGAGETLEQDVHRRAALERAHLGGDVRQHAILRRDLPALDELVRQLEQRATFATVVDAGIDADQRVARIRRRGLRRWRR